MKNRELEKLKEYMSLCGVNTNKELKTLGKYPKSEQYLGGILNGKYSFTEEEKQLLYSACNIARSKRLRGETADET